MDLVKVVNSKLPDSDRKITSIAEPGDINRRVAAIIAREVPADEIGRVIRRLVEKKRQTKYGLEDDCRAQEAGAKLWLAYQVGLPVQRTESVTVALDADSEIGAKERLAKSPAARKRLREMLDELEAVEVESVSEK